jgi:hypothetical protein
MFLVSKTGPCILTSLADLDRGVPGFDGLGDSKTKKRSGLKGKVGHPIPADLFKTVARFARRPCHSGFRKPQLR